MKPLEIKTKIRKWKNQYVHNPDGTLNNCYWNKMVDEEIQKLYDLLKDNEEEQKTVEEIVRAKADDVIMNYLTDDNPDGDFKKSTCGADDKKQWWIKGYLRCLEELVKIEPHIKMAGSDIGLLPILNITIPEPPAPPPARIIKEGQKPTPPKSKK